MKVTWNPAQGRYHFHFHPLAERCSPNGPPLCTACAWGEHIDCFGKLCSCATRAHQ